MRNETYSHDEHVSTYQNDFNAESYGFSRSTRVLECVFLRTYVEQMFKTAECIRASTLGLQPSRFEIQCLLPWYAARESRSRLHLPNLSYDPRRLVCRRKGQSDHTATAPGDGAPNVDASWLRLQCSIRGLGLSKHLLYSFQCTALVHVFFPLSLHLGKSVL